MESSLPAAVLNASDPVRDFRTAWAVSLGLGVLLLTAVGVEGRQGLLLPAGWFAGLFLSGFHLVRASRQRGPSELGLADRKAYSDAGILLALAWAITVPLMAPEAGEPLCFLLAGALSCVARLIRPLVSGERIRLGLSAALLGLPMLVLLLRAGTPLGYLLAVVVAAHVLMFISPGAGSTNAQGLRPGLDQTPSGGRLPSAFVAAAAAEMRPAVHAILGLLHGCRPSDGMDQIACNERLRGAARYLLGLIDAVADVARAQASLDLEEGPGAFALDVDRVALDELVGNVLACHVSAVAAGNTRLQLDMMPLPPCLLGDGGRITHALHSLLAQGLRPTLRGGLTLEVRRVRESRLGVLVEFRLVGCEMGLLPEQLEQLMKGTEPGGASEALGAFGALGLRLLHLRHLAAQMGGGAGVQMGEPGRLTVWFSAWLARRGGRDPLLVPVAAPAA